MKQLLKSRLHYSYYPIVYANIITKKANKPKNQNKHKQGVLTFFFLPCQYIKATTGKHLEIQC